MENEEINELPEDSTELLIEEYDKKRRNRADDIIATQAVLCILIGALFIAGNMLYPDITGAVFSRIKALASDNSSVMPNPIDLIAGYIDKH